MLCYDAEENESPMSKKNNKDRDAEEYDLSKEHEQKSASGAEGSNIIILNPDITPSLKLQSP